MPAMRLVEFAAVFGTGVRLATSAVPPCAVQNKGYHDPAVPTVNGGIEIVDAQMCQNSCANMPTCKVFTYYTNSGGCWLQGGSGKVPEQEEILGAWSGPSVCPEAMAMLGATATENASGNGTEVVVTDNETAAAVVAKEPEASGFPWLPLLACAVAGVAGAIVLAVVCCGKEKREKKAKKKRSTKMEYDADAEAASPSSFEDASPASPGSMHTYRVAPPVYVQAWHTALRATPLAHFAPPQQTLFDQIDTDHNGQITREEYQAWQQRQGNAAVAPSEPIVAPAEPVVGTMVRPIV